MSSPGPPRRFAAALLFAGALALVSLGTLAGCAKGKYSGLLPENQRPEVELTQAPASTTEQYFYAYELRWAGFDADGVVDHYLYCVDPPTEAESDTPWVATTANREVIVFRADVVDSASARSGHAFHTFVIKAVDNGGLPSPPVHRSFNAYTITPSIKILSPIPNHLFTPTFGPSFRVTWKGDDPDGRTGRQPVKYKYKVLDDGGEFDLLTALLKPDSLRRYYAPGFSSWDSVGGDTTHVDLRDLSAGSKIIVIVAFDEAGAYSPVFGLDDNMLLFNVSYSNALGPTLTLYNEYFYYKYPGPKFSLDPSTFLLVDLPADTPVPFHWSATTHSGTFVAGYRWKLDGDVADETPRTDENYDVNHWSRWSNLTTDCTLPPLSPPPGQFGETHFFYLEAKDNEGQTSLSVVRIQAVRPQFDKELLVVDDTRYKLDSKLANGNYAVPSGAWPTAAELDTCLYAIGGQPWRTYPAGILSPPGMLAGYDFDTLATRYSPNGMVTLGQLSHYRKLIWIVDGKSAAFTNPVDYPRDPMPVLHAVSYPGQSNPLTVWVKQGGRAWLMGGGAALCLQREWEKYGTNQLVFSNADSELVEGRFLFDIVHWRSEVTSGQGRQAQRPTDPHISWPGEPDYSILPDQLREKTAATDPFGTYAANRGNASEFFQTTFSAEVISKPNVIVQDFDPFPNVVDMRPVLDTLYVTSGGAIGTNKPIMTLYHGGENAPFVYSGFPIWYFQRQQGIAVTDFVLQNVWGLPRRPVPR